MKSIDKAMTNGHAKNMDKQPLLEAQKTPSVPKKEFQDLWRNQAGVSATAADMGQLLRWVVFNFLGSLAESGAPSQARPFSQAERSLPC